LCIERWQPRKAGDGFDEAGAVEGGVAGSTAGIDQLFDGVDHAIGEEVAGAVRAEAARLG
jgi:hypothetical protein